jgi:hypothetical protein
MAANQRNPDNAKLKKQLDDAHSRLEQSADRVRGELALAVREAAFEAD